MNNEVTKEFTPDRVDYDSSNELYGLLFDAKCRLKFALTSDALKDRKDFMKLHRIINQLNELLEKY